MPRVGQSTKLKVTLRDVHVDYCKLAWYLNLPPIGFKRNVVKDGDGNEIGQELIPAMESSKDFVKRVNHAWQEYCLNNNGIEVHGYFLKGSFGGRYG
jgi:hypothetical protein